MPRKLISPAKRREAVELAIEKLDISERRACKVIGLSRSAWRYEVVPNPEQDKLKQRIIELAGAYGRYGYRQITDMLKLEGWDVGKDRVHTVWKREGLKVPQKQPRRGRLWLADGSCIRLRPERPNHVWSYDFVSEKTNDGRPIKILNIIDEYTRECLASVVRRRIRSIVVIHILADLFLYRSHMSFQVPMG